MYLGLLHLLVILLTFFAVTVTYPMFELSMSMALLLAVGVTGIVFLVLYVVFGRMDPAEVKQYRPCAGGWCESKYHQCDLGLTKIPQQPVNTYSNLAFALGGALCFFWFRTPQSLTFMLLMIALCVGSALYHATSTRWGGQLDVAGIYAVFTCLGVLAIFLFLKVGPILQAVAALGLGLFSGWLFRYKYKGDMQIKIAAMLLVIYTFTIIGTSIWKEWKTSGWLLIGSLVSFAIAFLIWNLDKSCKFPLKRWGHGFWHMLAAVSCTLIFWAIGIL